MFYKKASFIVIIMSNLVEITYKILKDTWIFDELAWAQFK